jgi:nitrite reductase/ring-hydroxylating ferredoxin subunit
MFRKNTLFSKVIVLIVFLGLSGCGKENVNPNQGLIPRVVVNFYIQPNTIDYIPPGSWRSFDEEGHRGILVYRLDQTTFLSYERTCPYDPQEECARVEVDLTTFTLVDSCCMSRFNMLDGTPVEGPSDRPLLQYFNDFDGNYLHIYSGK